MSEVSYLNKLLKISEIKNPKSEKLHIIVFLLMSKRINLLMSCFRFILPLEFRLQNGS